MYLVTPEDKWLRPETGRQALTAGDFPSSDSASIAKSKSDKGPAGVGPPLRSSSSLSRL
ncbi:hypothetical protein M407DRAFT_129494 [Tulasnella calospora MUT 4182]|uniref:Uncharacterized protein n=1 Tax=Tulasnella calospora MUT 4182 TaxID=1051891 RepID=A0A0C3Q9J3_9AGAM|nr:hypothetical protein M407DRAFT_129494 [Tulasnella calospora MUT 4182]